MLTIEKSKVANWMLLSYNSERTKITEKIELFKRKYNQTFSSFELKIKTTAHEDFEKWDDYIEWKAYEQSYSNLNQEIDEIEKGHFNIT